jgi:hypothetical protein
MTLKTHGVTADTPQNLLLGAGAFYKGLKFVESDWTGTILGATSGGGKVSITPEYYTPDIDGAAVKVKGMTFKTGETASIEVSVIEASKDIIADSLHLAVASNQDVTGYTKYISKKQIDEDDYIENLAWVGTLTDGRNAIIILPNALVTSAFEIETKNKEAATFKLNAECTATFEQDDLEHLPYEIYFADSVPEV